MPKIDLWYHVNNFCDKKNKNEHREITVWIEEQYKKRGFPIPRIASQVKGFNEGELIQIIHWMNHRMKP